MAKDVFDRYLVEVNEACVGRGRYLVGKNTRVLSVG